MILALSNSGESAELADILAYSRRFEIPLMAITGGRRLDAWPRRPMSCWLLPRAAEACPMGLAPTTSTTMMMALGDALAIALLERKGFSSADFQLFHPGGRLGRRLLRVGDIMHAGDERAAGRAGRADVRGDPGDEREELRLRRGVRRRTAGWSGSSPTAICAAIWTTGCSAAASPRSCTGTRRRSPPPHLAAEALGVMNRFAITALFVVDEAMRPAGFLHMHDCLRAGVA